MQAGKRKQQEGFGRRLWWLYVPKNHGTSGRTAFQSTHAGFILTPYAFSSCSFLFPLVMPHNSLFVSSLSYFPGVEWLPKRGSWKMEGSWKWHVMGLTKIRWHSEEQTHCDWPWGFGKWKKLLSCSLKLKNLRWKKDRAPPCQAQEFYYSSKLPETATMGWVLRVSCYHPL